MRILLEYEGGAIAFDAAISETHLAQADVTKYPVESGFNVSDHVIRRNRRIIIDAVTTNQTTVASVTEKQGDRVKDGFDRLHELCRKGSLVTVSTMMEIYENCVITAIQTRQDKDSSLVFKPTITLEQLYVIGRNVSGGVQPKELEEVELLDEEAAITGKDLVKAKGTVLDNEKDRIISSIDLLNPVLDFVKPVLELSKPTFEDITIQLPGI